jgi:hypothetical protein
VRTEAAPRVFNEAVGDRYLQLMVINPTSRDLAAIAELADPASTCIDAMFSGLPRE